MLEPFVDPRVELDVHRERVLHPERVGAARRRRQAAAGDGEDDLGAIAVAP